MINLNDLTREELYEAIKNINEPKFRADQIFSWFSKGITDINEMTNISASLKNKITENYNIAKISIEDKFVSKIDETTKYLLKLDDDHVIESVAMHYNHGISVCISTEVGCKMGCKFCASTIGGKIRDLTAGEILGQVAIVAKDLGKRVSNIVLMGIGEPLDNFSNVITFLKNVNDEKGLNIGYRHISLSTCGLVDKIYELAKFNFPITLSVSLHAPDNETRNKIMPVNHIYKVEELIKACRSYIKTTNRRISFEYILINELNDTFEHAKALAKLIHGMQSHVNLIPANFVKESGFVKSTQGRVMSFKKYLEDLHVNVTIRRELGSDISASCGQLRQKKENIKAE